MSKDAGPIGLPFICVKKTEDEMTMLMHITTCFNIAYCLCAVALCLMLFSPASPALAVDGAGDEFLTGYIASILERDVHWQRNSYRLKVDRGVATITLFKDDLARRAEAEKQLRTIDGLQEVAIVVETADRGKPGAVSRLMSLNGEGKVFPVGDLFRPLLADPNQPQFFVSINRLNS